MDSLIRTIRHFIPLTDEEEMVVTGLFTSVRLRLGEYFLEEGKICRSVGFVETGLVRYFMTQDGNEKTIYFSGGGGDGGDVGIVVQGEGVMPGMVFTSST